MTGRGGPGATQLRVRETMLAAGGYWSPLAAVARLLEELAELLEALGAETASAAALRSELADLWIITAALGDQFLARLAEPSANAEPTSTPAEPRTAALALVVAAGPIARVVNYYDGPKIPRDAARLPSLRCALAAFHSSLAALASALDVALERAVADKLDAILASADMRRFDRDRSDPSTAAVLEQLATSALATGWPTRLWGGPPMDVSSVEQAAGRLAPSLRSFTRGAAAEELEGYVLASPGAPDRWVAELLQELSAIDPARQGRGALGDFAFNGVELEVRMATSSSTGGPGFAPPGSEARTGFALLAPRLSGR